MGSRGGLGVALGFEVDADRSFQSSHPPIQLPTFVPRAPFVQSTQLCLKMNSSAPPAPRGTVIVSIFLAPLPRTADTHKPQGRQGDHCLLSSDRWRCVFSTLPGTLLYPRVQRDGINNVIRRCCGSTTAGVQGCLV